MNILGIDTSCDDTSAAVLTDWQIRSNIIASQDALHRPWGGVVPNLARQAHTENLPIVWAEALQTAHLAETAIDAIAVTRGPGLAIALETGLQFAWELSQQLRKPLYAVNHLEGHLLSSLISLDQSDATQFTPEQLTFPALGLLVSGGHTEIILLAALGKYTVLGETQDDALGEAFDKVARLLGLGYPGGAALARLADSGHDAAYPFPIAMKHSGNYHVSYSGLKTAASRLIAELTKSGASLSESQKADMAASFQQAAVSTILYKVEKALDAYPVQHLLLGGGAAANQQLQSRLRQLESRTGVHIHIPTHPDLFRDNAAMIAAAGNRQILTGETPVQTHDQLDRLPRWRIDQLTDR
jgi:N6-L-threonylcarbamoyladenine synthase